MQLQHGDIVTINGSPVHPILSSWGYGPISKGTKMMFESILYNDSEVREDLYLVRFIDGPNKGLSTYVVLKNLLLPKEYKTPSWL